MKAITIPIPEKKDWIRWLDIIKFKWRGGFRCRGCNQTPKFNTVRFDSRVHGKPLIFHNSTPSWCPHCTFTELFNKKEIVFTEHNCQCDWCGEHKDTMSFPRDKRLESSVTFGSNYWNGHHICLDCLKIAFDVRDPLKSDVMVYENGKMYYRNELGLLIEPEVKE